LLNLGLVSDSAAHNYLVVVVLWLILLLIAQRYSILVHLVLLNEGFVDGLIA
jgi:hypothetical protein